MSEQIAPLNADLFSLVANGTTENNPTKNQGLTDFSTELSDILKQQDADTPRIEPMVQPDNILPDIHPLPIPGGNAVHSGVQKSSAMHSSDIIVQSSNISMEDKKVRSTIHSIVHTASLGNLKESVNTQSLPVSPIMREGLPTAPTKEKMDVNKAPVKELLDPDLPTNTVSSETINNLSNRPINQPLGEPVAVISIEPMNQPPNEPVAVISIEPMNQPSNEPVNEVPSRVISQPSREAINEVSRELNSQLKEDIPPDTLTRVTNAEIEESEAIVSMDVSTIPVTPGSEVKILDTESIKPGTQEIKSIPIDRPLTVGQAVNKQIDSVIDSESLEASFPLKPNQTVVDSMSGEGDSQKVDKENNQQVARSFYRQTGMDIDNQKKIVTRERAIENVDTLESATKISNDILNKSTQLVKNFGEQAESIQKHLKQYQIFTSPNKAIEPMAAEYGISSNQNVLLTTTHNQVSTIPSQPLQLDKPITDPAWGDELGEQIKWISKKQMQSAEIRLNPAHLGSMEVKIQMQNNQATIQITAMNASVKEALEIAIPRLREMMEASGIQLADVEVNEHSGSNTERQEQGNRQGNIANHLATSTGDADSEHPSSEKTLVTPILTDFSVDLFA